MTRLDFKNLGWWIEAARTGGYRAEGVATVLNVGQRHLRRLTQEAFELSPQSWLNDQRLVDAPVALRRTRSVKLASAELGFKQASHFSRKFTERYGMSPESFLAEIKDQEKRVLRSEWADSSKAAQMSAPDTRMSAPDMTTGLNAPT